MSNAEFMQLITAVTIVPIALLLGVLATYFVANLEQIKHKWRSRRWKN